MKLLIAVLYTGRSKEIVKYAADRFITVIPEVDLRDSIWELWFLSGIRLFGRSIRFLVNGGIPDVALWETNRLYSLLKMY